MNAPVQQDMFRAAPDRAPVMIALGMGVDSVAMTIEMFERGMPIDQVLFADTGSERPETYEYEAIFSRWMRDRSIPYEKVRYSPKRLTKNQPHYNTLEENMLTNGTLPSISFGFSRHSCSSKWKLTPQHDWTKRWEPAIEIWAAGGKVRKAIGYDCSPADIRRHAKREGYDDSLYELFYPLREWGWVREQCMDRIQRAGLPIWSKSACFFCAASKVDEIRSLPKVYLRRIVLMEARAHPRLKKIEGLWCRTVKGMRGAQAKPGSMTAFIRMEGLLPEEEIDLIWNEAPTALIAWQEAVSDRPMEERPAFSSWLDFFDAHGGLFQGDGARALYGESYQDMRQALERAKDEA
jgi:hypothetical protein